MRALVIVDYQYDFVEGSLGFPEAKDLEQRIVDKIMIAESNGDDIFFTADEHDSDYLETQEGRNLPIEHCCTEKGRAFYGRIADLSAGYPVLKKNTFGSMDLIDALSDEYSEIEICGLVTNLCVIANAVLIKSKFPETRIVVDSKCVSSYDMKLHEEALDIMEGLQISIIR